VPSPKHLVVTVTLASEETSLQLSRYFTIEGVHPDDEINWERRDARITNWADGSIAFEQRGVEFPAGWSTLATNIVTQKYFRGELGTAEREFSLRQVIDRVVDTIAQWGAADGYFADAHEEGVFRAELTYLLLNQRAAFNSPVWFNIGVKDVRQQSSACFILSVDDTMDSILNWYTEEGRIFKGGSGAGVNLSRIRSASEQMNGGGSPSGPVSFMRGADASAGTIKSGGKTRRAAKMVVLDADHPDIQEFIWCKAIEERKARALADAGFDMSLDGKDTHSIQYQNANNSVRLTDEFMKAVADDGDWNLTARTTGDTVETVSARALLRDIAAAAWEVADPGVQYTTTINDWHTSPSGGPISASNPCSEYLSVDNSACNLASINLLAYLDDDGVFDVEGFRATVRILILAQEILVGHSEYPTEAIGENTLTYRQLGLGFTNLGALLMAEGIPYDSKPGRAKAATITALMTGEAYRTSSRIAERMGPFDAFEKDRSAVLGVLDRHKASLSKVDCGLVEGELIGAARSVWADACEGAEQHGVRNAQVSVLAPTGTISFMMDADTTGIEPDFALVKHKQLVGGGSLSIVNRTVPRALARLSYSQAQIDEIVDWVTDKGTMVGAPHLRAEDQRVFACSVGTDAISPNGHIAMMGAVQPFLSGGISKTVNMPESATAEDIEQLFVDAWLLGVKAVAIYRDNSKLGQPLSSGENNADVKGEAAATLTALPAELAAMARPVRERLPRSRRSRTFEFRVADCKGFVTVGEYDDGRPGEVFLRVSKQGSTLAGIMDAFAIALSHGLQYGVPLKAFADAFVGMRFEPAGITDDPDLRISSSLIDYLFRRLALEYLSPEDRQELNIFSTEERLQPTLPGVVEWVTPTSAGSEIQPDPPSNVEPVTPPGEHAGEGPAVVVPIGRVDQNAPMCMQCGTAMIRAGVCFVCSQCGSTSGCS